VEGDEAHFLTLTCWDSFEAIEAFAGADISRAKYPEDADFLPEFESTVEHIPLNPTRASDVAEAQQDSLQSEKSFLI